MTRYFGLEPLVAGELGEDTQLDTRTHPPKVLHLDYRLDGPPEDDLIESFPVFLASTDLADRLAEAQLSGFSTEPAALSKSDNYVSAHGDGPPKLFVRLIPSTPIDRSKQRLLARRGSDALRVGTDDGRPSHREPLELPGRTATLITTPRRSFMRPD